MQRNNREFDGDLCQWREKTQSEREKERRGGGEGRQRQGEREGERGGGGGNVHTPTHRWWRVYQVVVSKRASRARDIQEHDAVHQRREEDLGQHAQVLAEEVGDGVPGTIGAKVGGNNGTASVRSSLRETGKEEGEKVREKEE
jgi:hypothetical protein